MDLEMKGRTAMVIGGARGIGFATAKELAAAGVKVAIVDLDGETAQKSAQKLADDMGVSSIGLGANIASLDDIETAVGNIEDKLGKLDICIVTAAIVDDKLFAESGPSDWKRMIDICLYGPMNVLHVVLPGMIERKYGRIICMASDSARVGQARLSYYAAAKAGVIALIKSVSQEVSQFGITANVVSPGATDTELRQAREAEMRQQMGDEKYEKRVQKVLRMYPARRIGLPEDHAGVIAFLASDRASWITGQVLSVNGGFVMP